MKRTFGRFSNLGRSTTIRDVLIPVWAREYPIEVLRKRRCKPSVIRCPRIAGSSRLQFSEACIMNTGWRRLLHDPEKPWKSFLRRTGLKFNVYEADEVFSRHNQREEPQEFRTLA